MSTKKKFWLSVGTAAVVFGLGACSSGYDAESTLSALEASTTKVNTEADLPTCDTSTIGDFYYVIADSEFVYCNGSSYQSMSTTISSCVVTSDSVGLIVSCDGQAIDTIINGVDGTNGADGSSCTAVSDSVGVIVSCGGEVIDTLTNGKDGADGLDGTSCSAVSDSAGIIVSCAGVVIDTIANGVDGTSCSAISSDVGVIISCAGTVIDTITDGTGCSATITDAGLVVSCGSVQDTITDGLDGLDGTDGTNGTDGTSCSAISSTVGVIVSCGGVVIDTLTNGADGQSCVASKDSVGLVITCGSVVDTITDGVSCTADEIDEGLVVTCGSVVDTILDGTNGTGCSAEKDSTGLIITCGSVVDTITDGVDGTSCSATLDTIAGGVVISCDGTPIDTIKDGVDGQDGSNGIDGLDGESCSATSLEGVGVVISCGETVIDTISDGTSCTAESTSYGLVVSCGGEIVDTITDGVDGQDGEDGEDGEDGVSCTLVDQGHGVITLVCGETVTTLYKALCYDYATGESHPYDPATERCTDYHVERQCQTDDWFDPRDHFCDARDFRIYPFTVIGGQAWMSENLEFQGENGTLFGKDEQVSGMGRYYSHEEALGGELCPEGWSVPSKAQWTTLRTYIAGDGNLDAGGQEGDFLKGSYGEYDSWNSSLPSSEADHYEFHAYPAGYLDAEGEWENGETHAFFWASNSEEGEGYAPSLNDEDAEMHIATTLPQEDYVPLRCIRNATITEQSEGY
ncbi:MAG TPA: FISUMP domain-containing protein [Fibrobacteraceae bacterium]|nr:FISUMP domain-containing protein [Fibrobacteraceae bacterium]